MRPRSCSTEKSGPNSPWVLGRPADGAQHHLALDLGALALLGKADGVTLLRLLHLFHTGSGKDLYAPLFQNHAEILTHLPVHVGQDPVHGLQYRDPAAQHLVEGGKLHADDAAADDHQRLAHLILVLQQFVGGQCVFQPGDGGTGGDGAGGDENLIGGVDLALHLNLVGGQNGAGTPDQVHLLLTEEPLNALPQLLGHLSLAVVGGGKVHRGLGG